MAIFRHPRNGMLAPAWGCSTEQRYSALSKARRRKALSGRPDGPGLKTGSHASSLIEFRSGEKVDRFHRDDFPAPFFFSQLAANDFPAAYQGAGGNKAANLQVPIQFDRAA